MSRTRFAPAVIACLGDSLIYGAQTPEILHPWTDRASIDERCFPQVTFANHGKNSDVLSGFQERYTESIKNQGYDALLIQAPINDVQAGASAATICAALQALVDEAVADGLPVILCVTTPAGAFATWSPTKQATLLACRTYMLAMEEPEYVIDFYGSMGSTADPSVYADEAGRRYAYSDGLHDAPDGAQYKADQVAAIATVMFPATPEPEVEDLNLFGVTAANLYTRHFPQMSAPTTDSNPALATVMEIIDEQAAALSGFLLAEDIDALSLTVSNSPAYLWCRETLRLMAAIQVAAAMVQTPVALLPSWEKQLEARLKALSDSGYLALGGGVSPPAEQPDGPTHFIDNLDLDTSDNDADASSITAPLRRDDQL